MPQFDQRRARLAVELGALAVLRQIQKHKVEIDQKIVTGTSRVLPDQSDIFKTLKLTTLAENTTLLVSDISPCLSSIR